MTGTSDPTQRALTAWDSARFRAFAAAELDASPDEFLDNENLISLGLGSVSLMRLRALLRQDGLDISFSDLAQAGSVDGWSALAARSVRMAPQQTAAPPPEDAENIPFALTHVQRAYWLGRSPQIELGGVAAHGYLEIESSALDPERLEQALNRLISANPMLRAVITQDGEQQVLSQVPDYAICCDDQSAADQNTAAKAVDDTRARMRQQVLAFDRWPMFEIALTRLPADLWIMHVSFDILLFDIKSLELWVTQWWQTYDAPEVPLLLPVATFRDHVVRTQAREGTSEMQAARAYWTARVPDLPLGPDLSLNCAVSSITAARFDRVQTRLSAADWATVQKIARAKGLTGSAFLMALYARSLAVWAAHPQFCLTVTLFSRDAAGPDMADVIGDFTSLLPLEVDCAAHASMEALAKAAQSQLWKDLDHSALSGIEVLAQLAAREKTHGRALIPYVFTSGLGTGRSYLDAFSAFGRIRDAAVQTPQLLIDHQALEFEGGLVLNWDYVAEAFAPGRVEAIAQTHLTWLQQLVDEARWSDPALFHLAPQASFAPPDLGWDAALAKRPLFAPFQDQVRATPDQIAVLSGAEQISYQTLDQASSWLAHDLLAQGVGVEDLVAVHMPKGWQQIVAVLAVLKSGAAYMPVDPTASDERVKTLAQESRARIILTADNTTIDLPSLTAIFVDDAYLSKGAAEPVQIDVDPGTLAYVLFTSGTTGRPKGVMIEHQAALNTVLAVNQRNGIGPTDRALMISALHFDLSVYDVFGTLSAGGTLIIPDGETTADPPVWSELVKRHGVTVWNSVPALLFLWVEELETCGDLATLATLRHIFLSGDWVPVQLCHKVKSTAPQVNLVSMGGPTEGSIWQVDYPVKAVDQSWQSVPYGQPLANHTVHLLDDNLHPRPIDVAGEIYIGGAGLARGYWDNPDLTAECFIRHPRTGERLYRSGDWGRWTAQGSIIFLGRTDAQVKLNGLRLELGEVEAALTACAGVEQAAAVLIGETPDTKRLAAFVTTKNDDFDVVALRPVLAARLPKAFIPGHVQRLGTLPLSGNGKVDRRALSILAQTAVEAPAARTTQGAEAAVLEIWSDLLERPITDPEANFFTIGGSSLLATRLASRLSAITPERVQAIRIFECPTAAQQTALLRPAAVAQTIQDTASKARMTRAGQSNLATRRRQSRGQDA